MHMHSSEQAAALHFPVQAEVPETRTHLRLRTLLFDFLWLAFAGVAKIGSEQFVYWDPTDIGACLAPDAFVRFGDPDHEFDSWKVWEHGAPHVAIEIISNSDRRGWDKKLDAYRRMGVSELVAFNPEFPEQPLRIWDFVGDGLLERKLLEPYAKSLHLGGFWRSFEIAGEGPSLRLSHDEQGQSLFLTPKESEARRAEAETRRADAEAQRADLAERKLRELEALLGRES